MPMSSFGLLYIYNVVLLKKMNNVCLEFGCGCRVWFWLRCNVKLCCGQRKVPIGYRKWGRKESREIVSQRL